jgi:hypothetical protein
VLYGKQQSVAPPNAPSSCRHCPRFTYLRWLDKHERVAGDQSPLGLILGAGNSEEHVELLEAKRSGIRVAQYLTELPPQEVLRERLHGLVGTARERKAAFRVVDKPKISDQRASNVKRGRRGNSDIESLSHCRITLDRQKAIQDADSVNGDLLVAYKHQPCIEKRHEQLKSGLDVMPVNLKSPSQISTCLFNKGDHAFS